MNTSVFIFILFFAITIVPEQAMARKIMMGRSHDSFEVVLESVKKALESRGYAIAHEQKCDGGLQDFGYETDYYRVVFFGNPEEIRYWSSTAPELVPFMPLKIAVIAEADQSLIVSFDPEELGFMFTNQELMIQFSRWKNDIQSVMQEVSTTHNHHIFR